MKLLVDEFNNPSKKPLNELYLTTKDGKIKALNENFVDSSNFTKTKYIPLPLKNGKLDEAGFEADLWIQEMEHFNDDLTNLLKLKYYKFWSQMVYDKELVNNIVYFFQESVPFYLPITTITSNILIIEIYNKIANNALRVICRLITNKESDMEWMSREILGELIYSNYLISVPLMFDMISLYGPKNQAMLKKIFENIFKVQPNYLDDLKVAVKFMQKTFTTMQEELDSVQNDTSGLSQKYEDLTLYLINLSTTINLLLELVPQEVRMVFSRELKLEQCISNFYDTFIPSLYKSAFLVDSDFWFLNYINYARIEFINSFRTLLNRNIELVLNGNQKQITESNADEFLSVLTECAGHRTFINDYKKAFPVECDLDILEQSCKALDDIKLSFVREAYMEDIAGNAVEDKEIVKNGHDFSKNELMIIIDEEIEGAAATSLTPTNEVEKLNDDVIVSETNKILELFPIYGTGFIRKLLARYDNAERVITIILENNLDPEFLNCDQSEPYIPPEIPDKVFLETGVERTNVYDGDEFDVMRRDTFGGVVKKHGKVVSQKEPKNLGELLNDKTHVQSMKTHYQQYSLVTDTVDDPDYDDEYDDSYDALVESEPKIKLQANVKNVLVDEVESESESEEEREPEKKFNDKQPRNNNDFCENPEAIRARREQQYQSKMARKFPQKGNAWKNDKKDVVGEAKGQGQSAEVLRNRQNKSVNKSSRANHNRKQGAQFKQSKGMF